jgi:hypothetical protein
MTTKGLVFALVSAGALIATAQAASARIVCNSDGDCWHVRGDYEFKPEFGVVIHPDNWSWKEGEPFRWHEHEGRGYWKDGEWRTF